MVNVNYFFIIKKGNILDELSGFNNKAIAITCKPVTPFLHLNISQQNHSLSCHHNTRL